MRILLGDTLLLVIDVQERMALAMTEFDSTLGQTKLLIEGARFLALPVLVSEQYPRGLGATLAELRSLVGEVPILAKRSFSCWDDAEIRKALEAAGRKTIVLCGIEAHVCVLQTALDLVSAGYRAVVVVDAVASRRTSDRDLALARMAREGVVVTGVESLLFELTRNADHPAFKEISRLVR